MGIENVDGAGAEGAGDASPSVAGLVEGVKEGANDGALLGVAWSLNRFGVCAELLLVNGEGVGAIGVELVFFSGDFVGLEDLPNKLLAALAAFSGDTDRAGAGFGMKRLEDLEAPNSVDEGADFSCGLGVKRLEDCC